MGRLFSFRADGESSERPAHWLVVSCSDSDFPATDFWDELTTYVGENLRPDAIVFLARENAAPRIGEQIDRLLENETDWRVPLSDTTLWLAFYDVRGNFSSASRKVSGPDIAFKAEQFQRILSAGLTEIFVRRNGLIRPSASAHFVHPSGKHSQAFIRVANLMACGPEVTFIAIGLLPFLEKRYAYICVDTSSIAPIAYALIQLRQVLEPDYPTPTIDSFLSWKGVQGDYSFSLPKETFALVSASTSGNLAHELIRSIRLPSSQVVTLYSLAEDRRGLQILSDLSRVDSLLGPGANLEEHRERDCPLCARGSQPVHFVGDQFLADDIRHNPVQVLAKDAPKHLASFMQAYHGRKALGMNITHGGVAVNTYHIGVEKLQTDAFRVKFSKACRRHIPASATKVVHISDSPSVLLAQMAVEALPGLSGIEIIDQSILAREEKNSIAGAVVVTAGCTSSGSVLHAVSRDLRDPAGDLPRIYLVGFAKHSHLQAAQTLASDLAYSSTDYKHHMEIIEPMVLPLTSTMSAWEAERNYLVKMSDIWGVDEGAALSDAAEARLAQIDNLADEDVEHFFWESPAGTALPLRKTFAFWTPGYEPKDVSQGDVLMTIASVLENMRNGPKPKLVNTAFHHSVIAPSMFGRYNDGIIQAAFLRAAHPHELDYSADASSSNTMAKLLRTILEEWKGPRGEAALEFLMSIATGRLRIKSNDLLAALNIEMTAEMPPMLSHLIAECKKIVEG